MGRYQHGRNGQLDALLHGLPFSLSHAHKLHQPGGIHFRNWSTIRLVGKFGKNLFNTDIAGFGIANQDFLAAGLLYFGRIGAQEPHHVREFVLLIAESFFFVQRLGEFIIHETGPKHVIPFGQRQLEFFF